MQSNLAGSAAFARDVKPGSDVHSILPNQRSLLENKGYRVVNNYHVVNILQLTVSDDCLLTARAERRLGGFLNPPRTRPSNPLHQLDCC